MYHCVETRRIFNLEEHLSNVHELKHALPPVSDELAYDKALENLIAKYPVPTEYDPSKSSDANEISNTSAARKVPKNVFKL